MKYLPILGELFESDSVIFLIIGIVIAVVMGLILKKRLNLRTALITSVVTYAVCELLSNIHTNFMVEIILVFVGTAALGCFIEFLARLLIRKCKKQ
jgi:hypothetical protein